MSPGQQAQMPKAQWRTAFDNMVEYGDTVLFRPTSAGPKPLPVSWFDRTSGLKWLDDFAKGRVDAMRFAVSENVPEFAQSRLALMGRKELERQAFRESQGFDRALADKFAADAATKKAAALAKKGYLGKAIDIAFGPKTQKLYRLGMLAAAADYAFVKDTPEGYELTPWDGHIDTGWGAAGYIAGTGYYSTRLGINTYNGSINGGGMKAVTFVGFQGLAGLALFDSDIKKIAGAQDEYLVVLPATLLLYSGMHAKGGKSTILNAVSQLPFVRRIPSLSAYTSAYGAHSTIGSPSFIRTTPGFIPNNFKGMAVSLGYTIPFIMGVTAYTGGTLLSSDPYFIGQRGWKFFFVGTILNPIQIALGGDTGRAQSATRLLGLITDLLPAVSLSPYYNNSYNMRRTLLRMAGEKGPDDVDEELRLFVSEPDNWMSYVGLNGMSTVNRTFDLGGFIGRDAFEIAKPNTWNFGWRWEPDGVNAWLNAMEGYKDKKRGWIEGAGTTHPELYADMAFSFYKGFENPEFWMGTEHRTRGMLIYSIVAKWYAQRFKNGEQQFAPYANLLDQAPEQWRTGFWDRVPQVGNREELLRQVAVVQEMPIDEVEALMAASYKIDIGADK
jgi:hypothetical protein